jgi:hypothetical protein
MESLHAKCGGSWWLICAHSHNADVLDVVLRVGLVDVLLLVGLVHGLLVGVIGEHLGIFLGPSPVCYIPHLLQVGFNCHVYLAGNLVFFRLLEGGLVLGVHTHVHVIVPGHLVGLVLPIV